mmetsp:Transcript_90373/g.255100  ORF Transcript_90373/g.255100 Transcript_90373/m.255100 type:complete len:241 (-) Transcript_90373:2946-3668(-)
MRKPWQAPPRRSPTKDRTRGQGSWTAGTSETRLVPSARRSSAGMLDDRSRQFRSSVRRLRARRKQKPGEPGGCCAAKALGAPTPATPGAGATAMAAAVARGELTRDEGADDEGGAATKHGSGGGTKSSAVAKLERIFGAASSCPGGAQGDDAKLSGYATRARGVAAAADGVPATSPRSHMRRAPSVCEAVGALKPAPATGNALTGPVLEGQLDGSCPEEVSCPGLLNAANAMAPDPLITE